MATGDLVQTKRVDRYHVEIRHRGDDWHHIHGLQWETTTNRDAASSYAAQVRVDYPTGEVRIVETRIVEVTEIRTGETSTIDLGSKVLD